MKNHLKVSLLCITSLTLYGSEREHRKSGDKPTKAASFAGTPSPKVSVNPLAKSAPSAPIPMKRVDVEEWQPKSPNAPITPNDFWGLYDPQGSSPSPRDWRSIR